MIGKVDHRSRRKLGLVLLQGNLGGAWGPRARGLQLTLCRHKEESREGGEQACHHHHNRHKSYPDVGVDEGLQVISSWGKEFYKYITAAVHITIFSATSRAEESLKRLLHEERNYGKFKQPV